MRCDGSDGRAAASYPADPGSNLTVSGSIFDPLLSMILWLRWELMRVSLSITRIDGFIFFYISNIVFTLCSLNFKKVALMCAVQSI